MTEKPKTDWEAIERDYRAGQLSIREIARKHGLSDTAIRKEAKARKWERDLAEKVRKAVREELVRTDGSQAQRANDDAIIDAAKQVGVEVQLTHRRDLQQLRAIGAIITTRLAAYLNGEVPDGPFMGEKESPGDLFEKLSRVKSRLIPLERQAHSLDDDSAGEGGVVVKVVRFGDE